MTQQGEGISSDSSSEEPEKKEEVGVKIRFSVFFDGSLNNRTNIESRLEGNDIYQQNKAKDDNNSYGNDKTNVARMELYIDDAKDFDHTLHAYIEGSGTTDDQGDSVVGYVLGMGSTGVKEKVEKGLIRAVLVLKEAVKYGFTIDELVLDVFGFSRGAAGARYFIHQALSNTPIGRGSNRVEARPLGRRLRAVGYKIDNKNVKVRFVGLYDTVASEGIIYSNDTSSLKLDSIGRPDVETVIQLASADEHRANFSLTDITSARSKGKEIFLPGAHSDIGGGYRDETDEDLTLNRSFSKSVLEQDRKLLIARGWYQEQEIWIESPPKNPAIMGRDDFESTPQKHKLKVHRAKIGNGYDRIPLHIMADFARKKDINVSEELLEDENIPTSLSNVHGDLQSYAGTSDSSADDWLKGNKYDWLPDLRHRYFHFSAHYNTSAVFFTPHKPNLEKGKRVRKTHYG